MTVTEFGYPLLADESRDEGEQRHPLGDLGRVDLVRFHGADLVEHPQPRQGAVSNRPDASDETSSTPKCSAHSSHTPRLSRAKATSRGSSWVCRKIRDSPAD